MSAILQTPQQGQSGEKTSPENYIISTNNGKLEFGKLNFASTSGGLESSVTSGVHLQAKHPLHYMAMDNDGPRQGWTLNRSPGPYQILCASETCASSPSETDGFGFIVLAKKGDIVLSAPNGRIRLSAKDIDIRADGYDNTTGTINIDSNDSVNINAPKFEVKVSVGARIFSTTSVSIVANGTLSIIGNFVDGLTAASCKTVVPSNAAGVVKFIQNQGG